MSNNNQTWRILVYLSTVHSEGSLPGHAWDENEDKTGRRANVLNNSQDLQIS